MSTSVRFLHTADWQLGKPFGTVTDEARRRDLQRERIEVIGRIGAFVREAKACFVVVSGDLFDSVTPNPSTIAECCGQVGQIPVPVYVIGGNHDHAGAGSFWEQSHFIRVREKLAPNLHLLRDRCPMELEDAVLFPCSLLRRHESMDTTLWLRNGVPEVKSDKPRIIIAHGSIQGFGNFSDDEEAAHETPNFIDLERLPMDEFDYVALGDWHGTLQVGPKAWYSGTPESDRFKRGADHDPGNVLLVEAGRGRMPSVQKHRTGLVGWHELKWEFASDEGLNLLQERIDNLIGQRVGKDLLRLSMKGALTFAKMAKLDHFIADCTARLIRLRLENDTQIAPSQEELESLGLRNSDPLVATVARQLIEESKGTGRAAIVALNALRELHIALNTTH